MSPPVWGIPRIRGARALTRFARWGNPVLLLLAAPAVADRYVLVTGAWAGPDAWEPVAAILRDAGHQVTVPDLRPLSAPGATVSTYADAIVAAIGQEPAVLVAHSWGGRPATLAWDRARGQVTHVVYVESTAPVNRSLTVMNADTPSLMAMMTLDASANATGMAAPPPGVDGAPMPLAALYGAVTVAEPLPPTPCTMVTGTDSDLPILARYAEVMAERRGCATVALPGGHDLPTDAPQALAAVLLGLD